MISITALPAEAPTMTSDQRTEHTPWYERIGEMIESILRALSQAVPSDAATSGVGYSVARVTPSAPSALLKGYDATTTAAFDSSIAGKAPAAPAATMNPRQDKNVVKKNGATLDSKDLDWLEKQKKELNSGIYPFEKLDKDWKEIKSISIINNFVTPLKKLEQKSKTPSIEAIKDCLLQHSPLFAKAYELASRPKVSEVPIDSISMSTAFYDPFSHQIKIAKEQDLFWKARDIVFETVNALQSVRFRKMCELAEAGELGREEFTMLAEYLENDTLLWTDRIIGLDKTEKKNDYDFVNNWKKVNTPQKYGPKDDYIHANHYRKQWDELCSAAYLKKHPEYTPRG